MGGVEREREREGSGKNKILEGPGNKILVNY
jgi:hypothetical protein